MKNFLQKHKAGIVVTAFICGLFAHIVVGDPISKIVAGFTLDRYMAEKYPEYYYEDYSYDFTCNGYSAVVRSDNNPDVRFVLHTDTFGLTVCSDSYKSDVESGRSTENRLIEEYTVALKNILGTEINGYQIYSSIGSFTSQEYTAEDFEGNKYALESGPLIPGKEYNINEISATDGDIHLRVIVPDVTYTKVAEILLAIEQKLADGGLAFDTITLCTGENANCWPYVMELEKFPYSGIGGDDFDKTVEIFHKYNNPKWQWNYKQLTDNYYSMVVRLPWKNLSPSVFVGAACTFAVSEDFRQSTTMAYPVISKNGMAYDDLDGVDYISYTEEKIKYFANKYGYVTIDVKAENLQNSTVKEIYNSTVSMFTEADIGCNVLNLNIATMDGKQTICYKNIPQKLIVSDITELEKYIA